MATRPIEYQDQSYDCSLAHRATDALPWSLNDGDFGDIVESMKRDGFDKNQPILVDAKDKIIAGRRRELAALVAGIKPVYKSVSMSESEIVEHVALVDLHRRNLTPTQRAATIATLHQWADRDNGKPPRGGLTQEAAAEQAGVGERTMERTAKVASEAPELLPAMVSGDIDAHTASKVAELPKAKRKRVAASANPKAEARKVLAEAQVGDEPVHPFADLLALLTRTAGAVTRSLHEETAESKRLHSYMAACGLLDHKDVGNKGAQLVALRGVYRVVDLAGKKKGYSDTAIKQEYMKASGGWVPPLAARRRKAKVKPSNGKLVDL